MELRINSTYHHLSILNCAGSYFANKIISNPAYVNSTVEFTGFSLNDMSNSIEWVKKYKTKGVEIRVSGPNYYAYGMSSKWNPKKKRADKITGEYVGVVTREGIVKPRSMGMVRADYEYGNIALLHGIADRTII